MNSSKRFMLAVAFVLLAGLAAGAKAQVKTGAALSMPEPYPTTLKVSAIQISGGAIGYDKQETLFGYSFLGRTSDPMPGSLILSLNLAPAFPVPDDSSVVTGGAWVLPVYFTAMKRGDNYAGALFGKVVAGKINWDKTGTSAEVYVIANVDGGTKSWEGAKGSATFLGTLSKSEKGTTTLVGELSITFQ